MADCPSYKIDSNITGLRYAVEECLKQLPASPVWYPLEPNSYGDFGAKITTVARNPINPSRQKRKGVVTDLEASGAFPMDLTQNEHTRLMQGFLFAAAREKATSAALNTPLVPVTAISAADKSYAIDDATADLFKAGDLILASGFTNVSNNGLKTGGTMVTDEVVVTDTLVDEASPPATAFLQTVGFQFPSADVQITMNGNLPRLVSSATNLTTLGLIPGEWIYLGGDAAATTFSTNKGFARIGTISATTIQFDKVNWAAPAAEMGTGKTIRIFFGTVIRNEEDPDLVVRTTYQLERTLGADADGTMSQYVTGAVANELTLDMKQADKITLDLAFVGCDAESRSGATGLKSGARPALQSGDAFNTTSHLKRVAIGIVDPTKAAPDPLFAYCTDASLKIANGVTGNKALGILGNFDTSAGVFDVSGSLTAYFQTVDAIQAVRDNADITMDFLLVDGNHGIAIDVPLLSLGNGLPAVEQDKPITIPLDTMAAQSSFGHTLLYVNFPYLPNAASL